MSLINDALKKAQNMQAQQRPAFPAPSQPHAEVPPLQPVQPAPLAEAKTGPDAKTVLLIAGAVLVVTVGGLGGGGYYLLTKARPETGLESAQIAAAVPIPEPVATPVPAPVIPAAQESVAPIAPAKVATLSPPPQPAPIHTPPARDVRPAFIPPPAPEPVSNVKTVPDLEEPAQHEPAALAAQSKPSPAATDSSVIIIEAVEPEHPEIDPSLRGDPFIEAWVSKIEVSGVRINSSPKVLMNDRVFTIGEIVERKLKLKITHIEPRLLKFEGPDGHVYEYAF